MMDALELQWKVLLDLRIKRLHEQAGIIRTRRRTGLGHPRDPEELDRLLALIDHYEASEMLEARHPGDRKGADE
jgi:hypothetical protein